MKLLKSKKAIAFLSTVALSTTMFGTIANASSITKNIKAVYNNIKVSYNGEIKNMSVQPFIVDGSTYVPLRAIGEIMGSDVKWANNTVYITDSSSANDSLAQQLALKTAEANALRVQLQTAQTELEKYKTAETTKTTSSQSIKDTLKEIEDEYETENRIDWTFDLRERSNKLELTITYDSRNDGTTFNRLSESTLKSFVTDICEDIRDNHDDIEITGTIEDSRNNIVKAEFTYSKSDRMSFSLSSVDYDDFADDLERDSSYSSFRRLYNSDSEEYFDLPVYAIKIDEKNGSLTFTVEVNLSTATQRNNWNSIDSSSKDKILDIMSDIADEIDYEFDIEPDGQIKDVYSGNTIATFSNGRLRVNSVN